MTTEARPQATERTISVVVNGERRSATVLDRKTLADFLREDLELTGTHVGCEHGVCGACTLLLNGRAVRSCLLLAVQADGQEIQTIEGLAKGDELHSIQQAFWEEHGLQCGYCTGGIIMSTLAMLEDNPHPSDEEIYEVLGGHLCRCTGYEDIFKSVKRAIELRGQGR
ncbi:MAG: (2Fe-2S)-binding protein [Dehalococcoidia bacterium]|nr:(2Fe-2S)-binding protein [Dehalococcoidia bacterium]